MEFFIENISGKKICLKKKKKLMKIHTTCYGANVRRADPFIKRHGRKRAWVTHWQTGMYKARQREILGQAWVDDRRTISNRARQRVNPGNTGRNQNTGEQARL